MSDALHLWEFFSCCPGEHSLGATCLARRIIDPSGVKREIVSARDDDTFRVVTTWPSGQKSNPWTIDREGWMMLWSISHKERPIIPDVIIEAVKTWLGDEGREFFGNCLTHHGRADPVLPPEAPGMPPHPVHFREGMQVRNFLRTLPECKDWDAHDYDNVWAEVITRAVKG